MLVARALWFVSSILHHTVGGAGQWPLAWLWEQPDRLAIFVSYMHEAEKFSTFSCSSCLLHTTCSHSPLHRTFVCLHRKCMGGGTENALHLALTPNDWLPGALTLRICSSLCTVQNSIKLETVWQESFSIHRHAHFLTMQKNYISSNFHLYNLFCIMQKHNMLGSKSGIKSCLIH